MLLEDDGDGVLGFLVERLHQPGVHQVAHALIDAAHLDDALLVAQVRQLQSGAIVEPGARGQEDEGQNDNHNQVVLPSYRVRKPRRSARDHEFDLGPHFTPGWTSPGWGWAGERA